MSALLDPAACLDAQRARDLAANDSAMQSEMQSLADAIKARRSFVGPQVLRTTPAHVERAYYSSAYRSCCLCGGPSDSFTCDRCAEVKL